MTLDTTRAGGWGRSARELKQVDILCSFSQLTGSHMQQCVCVCVEILFSDNSSIKKDEIVFFIKKV